MTNEYVDKIIGDSEKAIKTGIEENDRRKAWRGLYRLQNLLKSHFEFVEEEEVIQ